MNKPVKYLLSFAAAAASLFAVTFVIYFLNLDMKFLSKFVEPILLKHYDDLPRDQYV